jgi:hypothetical protein
MAVRAQFRTWCPCSPTTSGHCATLGYNIVSSVLVYDPVPRIRNMQLIFAFFMSYQKLKRFKFNPLWPLLGSMQPDAADNCPSVRGPQANFFFRR